MNWQIAMVDDPRDDPDIMYSVDSSLFSLILYHGGKFVDIERRVAPKVYVGGSRSQIDFIDPDKFSIIEIEDIVKEVGCKPYSKCWFKVPSLGLCGGLRLLEKDRDILDMMEWVPAYRMLDVYLEHAETEGGGDVGGESEVEEIMGFEEKTGDGGDDKSSDDEAEEDEIDGTNGEDYLFDEEYEFGDEELLFDTNVEGFGLKTGEGSKISKIDEGKTGEGNNTSETGGVETDVHDNGNIGVASSDDDLHSIHSFDDEEQTLRSKHKGSGHRWPEFNRERDMKNPHFELGMLFACAQDFRDAAREYAILNKKEIDFYTNEKWRLRVMCKAPCKWMLYASKMQKHDTLRVKTIVNKHTNCRPCYYNPHLTSKWIAKKYVETIRCNPQIPLFALKETVKKDHTAAVTKSQVFRAKKKAQIMIEGTHKEQYKLLWRYCMEIKRAMPLTTIVLHKEESTNENGEQRFKRLYCCLGPLKKGFLEGCRHFIGLDGCFLKGPYLGQLLSDVGIDGNNGIYPFAYVVVEKETKSTWKWFLELLKKRHWH